MSPEKNLCSSGTGGISPLLKSGQLGSSSSANSCQWINKLHRYALRFVFTAHDWKEEGAVGRDNARRAQFPHVVSAGWPEGSLMKASSLKQDAACLSTSSAYTLVFKGI